MGNAHQFSVGSVAPLTFTYTLLEMAKYLICYDLNRPGQSYTDLYEAIKDLANGWWHHLDSTWIINHPGPATAIRNALKPHIDSNDELLVAEISGEVAWSGFRAKGLLWLKKHLKKTAASLTTTR